MNMPIVFTIGHAFLPLSVVIKQRDSTYFVEAHTPFSFIAENPPTHTLESAKGSAQALFDHYTNVLYAAWEACEMAADKPEPKLEEATVWHEGSQSFYHARLIRPMNEAEVAAELDVGHKPDNEDIMVWPDDMHGPTWCYRYDLEEYAHMSDDYEVLSFGTPKYAAFIRQRQHEDDVNAAMYAKATTL